MTIKLACWTPCSTACSRWFSISPSHPLALLHLEDRSGTPGYFLLALHFLHHHVSSFCWSSLLPCGCCCLCVGRVQRCPGVWGQPVRLPLQPVVSTSNSILLLTWHISMHTPNWSSLPAFENVDFKAGKYTCWVLGYFAVKVEHL